MCAHFLRNEAPDIVTLDSADVFVLVDNVSEALSSVPEGIKSEFDNVIEAGAENFSGDGFCFACFGISLIVAGRAGDRVRTVLFDGGPKGYAIEHNAQRLGIDIPRS